MVTTRAEMEALINSDLPDGSLDPGSGAPSRIRSRALRNVLLQMVGFFSSGWSEDGTPETPLEPSTPNGGDMTPVDPNTLTSYFAAVDAPLDIATPEADVAALFTPAAFQAGTSFMGRDVEPPGNYVSRKVEGFAIHPDLAFTHVIASPNTLRQDVTAFYVRKSNVVINGQTYHRYLAVRPGNWQNAVPDFLPVFNLHFRLEDN